MAPMDNFCHRVSVASAGATDQKVGDSSQAIDDPPAFGTTPCRRMVAETHDELLSNLILR